MGDKNYARMILLREDSDGDADEKKKKIQKVGKRKEKEE